MHLRLRKCEKLPQTYHKLADLRLRNTSCSFAVAELSLNLRCPGLDITHRKGEEYKINVLTILNKTSNQQGKINE